MAGMGKTEARRRLGELKRGALKALNIRQAPPKPQPPRPLTSADVVELLQKQAAGTLTDDERELLRAISAALSSQ